MTDIAKYVGQKIQEARKQKGLLQEHVASYMGLARASIVNIEAGRQRLPIDRVWQICGLLHVQPSDLFPPIQKVDVSFEMVEVKVEKVKKTYKPKFT